MLHTQKTNSPQVLYHHHRLLLLFALILLPQLPIISSTLPHSPPSDALALLYFKSKADLHNHLHFPLTAHSNYYCNWQGVNCNFQGKVTKLVLENTGLTGIFQPNSLSQLTELRVLSLQNNSLTGPIPNLSNLTNLKSLFLTHNSFSGFFPSSVLSLHRLKILDLSYNKLTGVLPTELTLLDRIYSLHLENNEFTGPIPALNQSSLQTFNVSGNNLTGKIPDTVVLSHLDVSSFSWNPNLCGEIINIECHSKLPFFRSSSISTPPPAIPLGQNEGISISPSSKKKNEKIPLIIGLISILSCFGLLGLVLTAVFGINMVKKQRSLETLPINPPSYSAEEEVVMRVEEENELLEKKVKKMELVKKSGNLVFCAGEAQVYNLDQLMTASAEMLGRGSVGTTYKAVLDNQLIVTVKRLDAVKAGRVNGEMFQRCMESVGSLRHSKLVPVRAYFQAKEERLIVYDYQPNGSLSSLVHGSRSARAKALHWTSCLKIAEDVVQGLAYIHQASGLIHGNLKSSNVLLGADFEACLTDYCLSALTDSTHDETDSAGYKAPETRKFNSRITTKSDVYSFGVLLLELLSGKPPSQHPSLVPEELSSWVQSVREVEPGEENRLAMLVEVAITCSVQSPEQRPSMWQVMKMIQEIKETVMMEDNDLVSSVGFS